MIKCRIKGRNGNEIVAVGIGPAQIAHLMQRQPVMMGGTELGLPETVEFVIFYGDSESEMAHILETEMGVSIPKDERGNYISVNG